MKTMLFTGILGITLFIGSFFNPGQPVPGAEVYLVQEGSDQDVYKRQVNINQYIQHFICMNQLFRLLNQWFTARKKQCSNNKTRYFNIKSHFQISRFPKSFSGCQIKNCLTHRQKQNVKNFNP